MWDAESSTEYQQFAQGGNDDGGDRAVHKFIY
jgi:hypothetical protein